MKDIIAKFLSPAVVMLLGLTLVILHGVTEQNQLFLIGACAVMLAGAFVLLNSFDLVKGPVKIGVMIVSVGMCGWISYEIYATIKVPIDLQVEKERRYEHVIQRLKDIRQAQLAYKSQNGVYAKDFGKLIDFVKYDTIDVIKSNGAIPDGWTLDSALAAGIVTRDTLGIPARDSIFGPTYLSQRKRHIAFFLDSLPYVPFSNGVKFAMEAGEVNRNSVIVQVFEVKDPKPFDPDDPMKVGSMSEPQTSGNWKAEK